MITQDTVKDRLILIIENEGINQKFIAKRTLIAESTLSKYKNGISELKYNELERLDTFLKSKGY